MYELKSSGFCYFMDLTKAFDYVDHDILMKKLYSYGVRGNTFNLIKSYLTNRKQATQITKICPLQKREMHYVSSYKTIKFGVPQGSVLGPLLFITYINDFPRSIKDQTILFADDSTIIFSGKNVINLELHMNYTLNDIVNWMTANNLKVNFDKTKIMTFKNRNNRLMNTYDISYSGKKINEIDTVKFLGLHVDCNLNWREHLESVCSKINQFSYALYMLGKLTNISTLLTAYHAYVVSTLRYGVIFWGNSVEKESVFKAQKKCIRAMRKLEQTDSCKPHFIELRLLTFPCLYIFESILFVRQNMTMFKFYSRERHCHKIIYPRSKTALHSNSVFGMIPTLYNHLPKSIIDAEEYLTFKRVLKKFLLEKAYYSVKEYLCDKF